MEANLLRYLIDTRARRCRGRRCSRTCGASTRTPTPARSTTSSSGCGATSRRSRRKPQHLLTVRGVGYRFVASPEGVKDQLRLRRALGQQGYHCSPPIPAARRKGPAAPSPPAALGGHGRRRRRRRRLRRGHAAVRRCDLERRASARRHPGDRRESRARSTLPAASSGAAGRAGRAIGAWMSSSRGCIAEDLLQPLDVAARRSAAARARPAAPSGSARESLSPADEAERMQQRAGEDGIGQRVGRARRTARDSDRAPRSRARARRALGELRRDLLAAARCARSCLKRLRRGPTAGSCSTPRAAAAARCARSRACAARSRRGRLVDRELEPRREHDRAQHADRILEEPHVRVADAADQPRARDPGGRRRSR